MTHTSEAAITEHIFEFINGRRTKCNFYFGTYMHEARQDRAQKKAKNFIILFLNRVASKARGDRDIKNTVCYWICFWKYTVIEIATWPSVTDRSACMISGGGHRRLQEARRQEMIREAAWAPDPNWPDPNWVRLWPDPMTPNRVTPVNNL